MKLGHIANDDYDGVLVGDEGLKSATAQVPGRAKEENSHRDCVISSSVTILIMPRKLDSDAGEFQSHI